MTADATFVLDFLNTVDVEAGTDVLQSTADWHAWAHERGLTPDATTDARSARHALRAAAGDPHATPDEDDRLRISVDVALDIAPQANPHLVADTAVAAVYAAAMRLAVLGLWPRVRICPADDCLWAFYDESRNRSRTWCSMRPCGNRAKARTFRKRSAAGDDQNSTHG